MAEREWKPGDVALVNDTTQPEKPWEPATCHASRTPESETVWVLHKNGGKVWGSVSQARPLVVIDAEDREQVERLLLAYGVHNSPDNLMRCIDGMQAALREFANPTPPKPEEPTGLGAVVEDAEGDYWVYVGNRTALSDTRIWQHAQRKLVFDEIDVVRVLSEGVQS